MRQGYDEARNVASVGTGARWGDVYADLEDFGVSVTGGRQAIVGVGGLLLGGGVGWTTPRTGFGCDRVVNYEVVLAGGEVVNANASGPHRDLFKALKGGSGNFGVVTRFDIEAFPASNVTLERRTVGSEHQDEFIDAMVGFGDLEKEFDEIAMAAVISYDPGGKQIAYTITEVNTANDLDTTAFEAFDRIPLLVESEGKESMSLSGVASVDAPELTPDAQNVGAGPITIANDPQILHYCFEQHALLAADLNKTLGPDNFTTILETQPLPTYIVDIGVQRGGNMLGLDRKPRNRMYLSLGMTLLTPAAVEKLPQVYEMVAAASRRVVAFAESVGGAEEFVYLPYADATQDPLGSYGEENVRFMKEVAAKYDPRGFFQQRVNGGFKLDRVA